MRGRGTDRVVSHANAGDLVQVGAVRGADDEELGEELLQRLVAHVCGGGKHCSGGGGDGAHLVHGVVQVTCASGEHVMRGRAGVRFTEAQRVERVDATWGAKEEGQGGDVGDGLEGQVRPAQRRALQLDASAVALHHAELEDEVARGGGFVMRYEGGVDLDG